MTHLRVYLLALCFGAATAGANQLDRLSTVPAYTGTSEFFAVAELTLTGCLWPQGQLAQMRASEVNGTLLLVVEAPRSEDLCPATNQPYTARLAVPVAALLGQRRLQADQALRFQVIDQLGRVIEGATTLRSAPAADVLPAAGAWRAEYGSRLWLDVDGGGLTLAFSSDDLGEADPLYDWPAPGRAVSWKGSTGKPGFAAVAFMAITPRVVGGVIDRYPDVRSVATGFVAFSDPFHGYLVLPSGVITPISKRHAGGATIALDPAAFPGPTLPDLSGEWVWVAAGSPLLGLRTRLTPSDPRAGASSWAVTLPGRAGGGSLSCTARGDCTLALTTEAGRPAAPLVRFSATEVGDQMILIEGQPAAYRLRY